MKSVSTFITFCVLTAVLIISAIQIIPVNPQNTDTNFSADRAFTYIQKIAKTPHPTGSTAHDSVRNYIVSQARAMGYQTEIQSTRFANDGKVPQISFLDNILVRIKGKNSIEQVENPALLDSTSLNLTDTDSTINLVDVATPKNTILIACHYDSRSNAAGAADDGAAVGAILEIMDMLKTQVTNSPFENDIIFLFSDGEEIDLLGAQAFMEQHSWAKEIGVAFNFEARGAGGMSILFETSDKNKNLLHHTQTAFKEAKKTGKLNTFGTSFANIVYQNMPNGTDASVFGEHNIPFLNFAFIGKHTHYHTPLDTPNNLDKRSLQQHGDYMLSLIRYFGDLKNLKTQINSDENVAFLGIPFGDILVIDINQEYLEWTIYGMLIFFALLFLSGLRYWSWKLVFGSLFGYLIIALTIGGLATLLWKGILMTHSAYAWIPYGTTYFAFWYQIAFALIFVGVSLLAYSTFFRSKKSASVLVGVLPFWIGLSALTVFSQDWIGMDLRPAAYLFIIPTLSMLVAWLYLLLRNNANYLNPFDTIILLALSTPTIYIFFPVLAIVPEALEAVNIGGFIVYGFALMALLIALLGGFLVPLMQLLTQSWRWSLALFLMILGIGILFWGALEANFTSEKPKPNSLFYLYNLDENKQTWISYDEESDDFTKQFLSDSAAFDSIPKGIYPMRTKNISGNWNFLQESKIVELDSSFNFDAPLLSLLSDSMINDTTYRYQLSIKTARNGEWVQIHSSVLEAIWSDTTRIPLVNADKYYKTISIWALPDSGAVIDVETSQANPEFWISELKYGLQEVDSLIKIPRKNNMMAAPYPYSESVIIQKKYNFIEEEN
ncbi:putative aminopeptidase [Bernardetia litoralis DSM 6794]|uniref:Vacuolar membrane protease n=1 Tax=Bernardetia litoralis (strain ATCC 23117 / DSM 6794 / NBRC 15988 / NCIMB 1366 / Fx l1 / Sio-4) TaxID=880071 RepID=I4AHM1_BERLS|nr:M28 family peptidase [Bernardetia litoralis]AFM03456.1 putative aminopeptidase [Bernardetia litoralis DSM 6794]